MMNKTDTPVCKEKTIYEEISELKIEESTKERILAKLSDLESQNKFLIGKLNEYSSSTPKLHKAIVMLSVIAAEKTKEL